MDGGEARGRFERSRIARLATADADGRPHLVAVCFALEGERLYSAVDAKPKRTQRLRRLANIAANPRVSVLVDHYEEEWSRLWWARADGLACVVAPNGEGYEHALELLAARYPQYRAEPPTGALIVVDVSRWSGWDAARSPA